jgi:hypothetical protein
VDEAVAQRDSWLERLRAGLVAFLGFFDDRPELGRLLLLEAPAPESKVSLRCEQRVLGVLTGLLDDGAPLAAGEFMPESQLVSELVAGGVVAVGRKRLIAPDGRLVDLAPELMAFMVSPYLGREAAQAELAAGTPSADDDRSALSSPTSIRRAAEGAELFTRLPGCTSHLRIQATSARSQGADESRQGALSQTGGVGGSPGGGLADRSIVNREDKGVVDK